MWLRLALRDLVLLAAFAVLWGWAAPLTAADGFAADFLGLAAGLGIGIGHYLLHEWGHAAGGLATGSSIRPAPSLRGLSLFSFDSKTNTRRQFVVMSLCGFLVTGLVLLGVYTWLPSDWLATRVARGAVLFLVALTVFVEFPLVIYALITGRLPPVETFDNPLLGGGEQPADPPAAT